MWHYVNGQFNFRKYLKFLIWKDKTKNKYNRHKQDKVENLILLNNKKYFFYLASQSRELSSKQRGQLEIESGDYFIPTTQLCV